MQILHGRCTYILFHVRLSSARSTPGHLEAQLCGGIIDEAAKRGGHVVASGARLARRSSTLLCISVSALGLRRGVRRRRRAKLGDCRHVLWDGMVKRR